MTGCKARIDCGFKRIWGVHDLNFGLRLPGELKWALRDEWVAGRQTHQRERSEDADLVRRGHLCANCLVKKELQLDEATLYTCLQILSVAVFEKTEISSALHPDRSQPESRAAPNQLILFDF